jgi:SulP family sulfate permease
VFRQILVAIGANPEGLRSAASALQSLNPCTEVEYFHLDSDRPGDFLDDLLHRAADTRADLLVIGARRHIIASRAAMLAPCSVLMVPDDADFSLRRFLVPIDFSESAADALRLGIELSSRVGGVCDVVAVECNDDPWLEWDKHSDSMSERVMQFIQESCPGGAVDGIIVEPMAHSTALLRDGVLSFPHRIEGADIAATIVSVAERVNASVIVLGTRGRTKSASLLLGSVAEQLMQLSKGPVLVVKRAGHHLGLLEGIVERLRTPRPVAIAN